MSENDINPVAWTSETQLSAVHKSGDGIMASTSGRWAIALYDQSAIDWLTTQLKHYKMAANAEADLADNRGREINRIKAERDSAVADAARYRAALAEISNYSMSQFVSQREMLTACLSVAGAVILADVAIDAERAESK